VARGPGPVGAARPVAHVFVDDPARPELSPHDTHHLARVLRLRPGETVTASDGWGAVVACEWSPPGRLTPLGPPTFVERPRPALTVALALTKGQHPELAVQKLTEAGVDRVVLMSSARCVARWAPAAQPRQFERLRAVARQAAMQSRRAYLPMVEGMAEFSVLAAEEGAALTAPDGLPPSLSHPTLLVGPEGGWSPEELAAVPRHVTLGPHVLRAETAAMAAGLLLAALRSGVVQPAP
jgi:16S rRNA (uracil1498-N3)-methyltransferase